MKTFKKGKIMEEYGYVLDILYEKRKIRIHGEDQIIAGPIGQIIGEENFILMEFQLRKDAVIEELERIYIGKGEKYKARRFVRYITYNDLSYKARENLVKAVELIVRLNEDRWVDFFNRAGPISPRTHALELLSLIGKKTVLKIIEKREKEPFRNFSDIKSRIKIDPIKVLVDRIVGEIKGEEKHYLFVRKPSHLYREGFT